MHASPVARHARQRFADSRHARQRSTWNTQRRSRTVPSASCMTEKSPMIRDLVHNLLQQV